MRNSVAVVCMCLLLFGCVPDYVRWRGQLATLPSLADPDNAANVVVIRKSSPLGSGLSYVVALDGTDIFALRVGDHVRFPVNPGRHVLAAKAPVRHGYEMAEWQVKFVAESDGTIYYLISPTISDLQITPLNKEEGEKYVANTKDISITPVALKR